MKGDSGVRCFQVILIFGNVIIGLAGLALTAECIFFVSDQNRLYPLLEATFNDDIFAAAWIGIFTGFCFFLLSLLGIVGVMQSNRRMLMAYLILMFIVYCFEVASAIVAATQRDFFTVNLFLKQMLDMYLKSSSSIAMNSDESIKSQGVTTTWNYLMLMPYQIHHVGITSKQDLGENSPFTCIDSRCAGVEYSDFYKSPSGVNGLKQCCGVNGPNDWQDYNSTFRLINPDSTFPWPQQCCVMNNLGQPVSIPGCRLGISGYLQLNGCYDYIVGPLNRHAWGVAWFGFAILCWTFWVLLGVMFYWTRIEY